MVTEQYIIYIYNFQIAQYLRYCACAISLSVLSRCISLEGTEHTSFDICFRVRESGDHFHLQNGALTCYELRKPEWLRHQ